MAKLGFVPVTGYQCAAGDEGKYQCQFHDDETVELKRSDFYPQCRDGRVARWKRIDDSTAQTTQI